MARPKAKKKAKKPRSPFLRPTPRRNDPLDQFLRALPPGADPLAELGPAELRTQRRAEEWEEVDSEELQRFRLRLQLEDVLRRQAEGGPARTFDAHPSLRDMAFFLGCTTQALSGIEAGKVRPQPWVIDGYRAWAADPEAALEAVRTAKKGGRAILPAEDPPS